MFTETLMMQKKQYFLIFLQGDVAGISSELEKFLVQLPRKSQPLGIFVTDRESSFLQHAML